MIEFIRTWISGICGAAILLSIFGAIAPKTSSARMVHLCGSMILVFAVFAPIYTLNADGVFSQFDAEALMPDDFSVSEIASENETFKASIIERQLTAYILQRAKQMGINCEVSVGIEKNDQGQSIPGRILISCKQADQQEMFEMIKNECGLEPEFLTTGSERVKE